MSDVDRILAGFIEAHRGGSDPDVGDWVQRVPAADRPELEALIDGYLVRAPGRKWDPQAYKDSSAERFVNSFAPLLESEAGLWPALLPRLRHDAQIKRADLVARLAADLGVQDRQEKVADYYHQMEQGSLDPAGVSERVLSALGRIVGRSAEVLRSAAQAFEPAGGAGGADAVFARTAMADPSYAAEAAGPASATDALSGAPPEWDEVDELFRGGA